MPNGHGFQHLPLLRRTDGPALLRGRDNLSEQTVENRANRSAHSSSLRNSAVAVVSRRQQVEVQRSSESLPQLPAGIPLLLEVDPDLDLDKLRHHFGLEIVSEEAEGFVIVASDEIDLGEFLDAINGFARSVRGTATMASVHRLDDDPNQRQRLEFILSDHLFGQWRFLDNDQEYRVDIGITCLGVDEIPKQRERRPRDSDADWARKQQEWANQRAAAYEAWDELQDQRLGEVRRIIVDGYGGRIEEISDELTGDSARLPDSFTIRVKVRGKGLKDFALNYPYVFEIVEPDDVSLPQNRTETGLQKEEELELQPPSDDAPSVCVIDSGIQEDHILLEPAIDKSNSRCFLPEPAAPTDVADYVRPGGHGTRVAGAILFGEHIHRGKSFQLPFWIQNARVLNDEGKLPDELLPAALFRAVVDHFHGGPRKTRIFNHSINADCHCRTRHMSAWAAEIDSLCREFDILVIQSGGNLRDVASPPSCGILDHLAQEQAYPDYLKQLSSRVANPAQSLQALTVGSVAYGTFESVGWRSLAGRQGEPSGFSRVGYGIWDAIKPEVVEYGGDYLWSPGTLPRLGTPFEGRECYPELVRSTRYPPGPAVDRDEVGTSYAAPKVTHIAAHLQQLFPEEPCLLYRALIVQSARWPEWANDEDVDSELAIRTLGYGVPNLERATTNTDYRTTFITSGEAGLRAKQCDVYEVPIPDSMRQQSDEYDVLIEVTLSYVAQPRRTRRHRRRYLSTWLHWESSRLGQGRDAFCREVLTQHDDDEDVASGDTLRWTLWDRTNRGDIRSAIRSAGTVQKDWALVKAYSLPKSFCIAVIGHAGWSKDPDSIALYSLAVSFEMVGQEIPIYDDMRVAVEELQEELEAEALAQVEVEA